MEERCVNMLNNISSQNIYPKQYQLKNNLKTNTNFTNFENSQDKISFKGGNITKIANNKSVIPIFSILGGVLTSLAIKFGLKEKTESIDDKITRYAEKYPYYLR